MSDPVDYPLGNRYPPAVQPDRYCGETPTRIVDSSRLAIKKRTVNAAITLTVEKLRWRSSPALEQQGLPDSAVIAFARDDEYFFGVLHSRIHELWARSQGTQLREVESGFRYTPRSTFETFPFPRPTPEQRSDISGATKRLNTLRDGWLNPPPDDVSPSELRRRTLTNLYNDPPTWLRLAHKSLDKAASAAYGWPTDLAHGISVHSEHPRGLPDAHAVYHAGSSDAQVKLHQVHPVTPSMGSWYSPMECGGRSSFQAPSADV